MVIGEAEGEVRTTFENKAKAENAPITFATDSPTIQNAYCENGHCRIESLVYGTLINELGGEYQIKNSSTVLTALQTLKDGGIQRVAKFSSTVVPLMAIVYLLIAVGVVIWRYSDVSGIRL